MTVPAVSDSVARTSTVWITTLTFGVLVSIGALVALGSAGSSIASMSVEGCRSGQPADLQSGVLGPSDEEIVETVRGWHAASVRSNAAIRSGDRPDGGLGCAGWAAAEVDVVAGARQYSTLDAVGRWLWLDTWLFVPGYALTLLAGLQLLRRAWLGGTTLGPFVLVLQSALSTRWVRVVAFAGLAVGISFDLAENVAVERGLARWWSALDVDRGLAPGTVDAMIDPTTIRVLGTLKFVGLLVPAAFVLVLAVAALVEAAVTTVRAFTKVWFPIVLTAVFAYAVTGPDQSADAVRRLSGWQGAATIAIVAGLALVMAIAASGVFEPSVTAAPMRVHRWHAAPLVAAGIVLGAIGFSSSWRGLAVPGGLLIVVGLISLLLDAASTGAVLAADDPAPADEETTHRRHAIATALAALLFVAAGVAVVRAAAPDLALLGAGDHATRSWRLGIGVALVVIAGPLAWIVRRLVLIASDAQLGLPATGVVTLLLTAVVGIPALLMCDPDLNLRWSSSIGSIGLLAMFVAGLVLIPVASSVGAAVLMHSAPLRPLVVPSLLRSLGFKTPPVLGLLVAWLLLAGQVSSDSYHAVRVIVAAEDGSDDDQVSRPEPLRVGDVASNWVERQTTLERGADAPGSRPAVIVAASGGGIRAAYWTSLVLTCAIERDPVDDDPCGRPSPHADERRAALLAMSGISGGSLGLASYVTAVGTGWTTPDEPLEMDWVDDHLGGDYLAPTLAALLFNDGVNTLLRPRSGVDRAAVLERAWEREWADGDLARPFFSTQAEGTEPILFLNGFNAENGCRVNVSAMSAYELDDIRVEGDADGLAVSGVSPDACDRVVGVEQVMWSTVDAIGVLCGDETDWRVSTAALASARFPFVSPAGRITGCTGEDGEYFEDVEVVDGGYRETSAASPLMEMWPALAAAIDAAAGAESVQRWCPVFVQIDNGYSPELGSELPSGASVLGQYTAPATAIRKSAAGAEAEARQQSYAAFAPNWIHITTVAHPGSSAPLGWVLSQDARDDLLDQLRRNAPWIALLRAHLDHDGPGCLLEESAAAAE